jgi:hypothetical protein
LDEIQRGTLGFLRCRVIKVDSERADDPDESDRPSSRRIQQVGDASTVTFGQPGGEEKDQVGRLVPAPRIQRRIRTLFDGERADVF